jgi:hypothetical protein
MLGKMRRSDDEAGSKHAAGCFQPFHVAKQAFQYPLTKFFKPRVTDQRIGAYFKETDQTKLIIMLQALLDHCVQHTRLDAAHYVERHKKRRGVAQGR